MIVIFILCCRPCYNIFSLILKPDKLYSVSFGIGDINTNLLVSLLYVHDGKTKEDDK